MLLYGARQVSPPPATPLVPGTQYPSRPVSSMNVAVADLEDGAVDGRAEDGEGVGAADDGGGEELDEGGLVGEAHAVVDPGAVVVHLLHAPPALPAVMRARRLVRATDRAELESRRTGSELQLAHPQL